ncbi:MAG: transporter [Fibrobacteria bacterium]
MKKVVAIVGLALIGSSFGLDEYLPVEASKLEVDLAYNLVSKMGDYDPDGKKVDLVSGSSASLSTIPLQIKYGIMPGLDLEVLWAFGMLGIKQDAAGFIPKIDTTFTGFGQPEIAVKYALMDIGAGAYVNFIAPFATGDFAEPDAPPMALALGAVYTKLFMPQFNLTAQVQYRLNFEAKDSTQDGNVFTVYAKPEFRFNEFGGAYLGLKYDMTGESKNSGEAIDDSDGNLFTLLPGWNATWLPNLATEVNVPYTLMGKNSEASWGVNVNVYYTVAL